ncbi:hypothetical protein IE077_003673, partial [Cardiosporidium cionae]
GNNCAQMIGVDLKLLACCTTIGCCAIGGYTAYKNRRRLPHPSEIEVIGKAFLLCGCHNHEKFDLLTEIHEIKQAPLSSKCLVEVVCGRFDAQTQPAKEKNGTCSVHERLSLHVRQCDNWLKISTYKKGIISNELLGMVNLEVVQDLIQQGFPKRRWYTLSKEGRSTLRIQVSFHKLDTDNVSLGELPLSPLVQQALLHAQYQAESEGKKVEIDIEEMGELEQLRFFSKVLEGPLQKMKFFGNQWENLYFKAVERSEEIWQWQYWNSKQSCQEGGKCVGVLPFLAISLVLPDQYDRACFYVKYHDVNGAHDMFLRRVDRDRNIWSEGLYEFIEKLRAFLDSRDNKIITFIKKREGADSTNAAARSQSENEYQPIGRRNRIRSFRKGVIKQSNDRDHELPKLNDTTSTDQRRSVAEIAERMADGLMYVTAESS